MDMQINSYSVVIRQTLSPAPAWKANLDPVYIPLNVLTFATELSPYPPGPSVGLSAALAMVL